MSNTQDKKNPFAITKANDFTDEQIDQYWVDMDFRGLIDPTSRKSMIILGGKGSGKTHVLRYFSYNVQKIRAKGILLDHIKSEGHLGIYLLCNSLNAGRFSNKGINDEVWEVLFDYYFELEIAELLLRCLSEILIPIKGERHVDQEEEKKIVSDILSHFASPRKCENISELVDYIAQERKDVDFTVNNCVFTGKADHVIQITRGRLIYALPAIFESFFVDGEKGFNFVYIIDELENLTECQQKFIHTLYREKRGPCTFRIGVRLYGLKSKETYAAEQRNVDGSEHEEIYLDNILRSNEQKYKEFAQGLLLTRLQRGGFQFSATEEDRKNETKRLTEVFGESFSSCLSECEKNIIRQKYQDQKQDNPWIKRLEENLNSLLKIEEKLKIKGKHGVESKDDIRQIMDSIKYEGDFYIEKCNCFYLYRKWAQGKNILNAASQIRENIDAYINKYHDGNFHFKSDMIAQIRRETDLKQVYSGLKTFLTMTAGAPRYLLVLMKKIYDWAVYCDECPFIDNNIISHEIQKKGLQQTVDMFYKDITSIGENLEQVKYAIDRLGNLFRKYRFAHKPSECTLTTFTTSSIHPVVEKIIAKSVACSLLICDKPRRGKASDIEYEFQINPMLAPRWDLSTAQRGTLKFSPDDLSIIFGEASKEIDRKMDKLEKKIIGKMTAPEFGKKLSKSSGSLLFSEDSI
jgi:hypothetical protein